MPTFPAWIVVDDSGAIVTGATVAIASVTEKDGTPIASHGAAVNVAGANVSIDYDPEAHGEAWITLAISKVGSTFTGINAAPAIFVARDSGRILGALPASGVVDANIVKVDGQDATAASGVAFPASVASQTVMPSWYVSPSFPTDYARDDVAPSWFALPTPTYIAAAIWDAYTADHAVEGTFGLETITMLPPDPWQTQCYVKDSPAATAHQFAVRNVTGSLDATRLSLGIDAPGIGGRIYRVATAVDSGASSPGPGNDYLITMLDDLPIAPDVDAGVYLMTGSAPHAADLVGYKLASDGLDAVDPGTLAGVATTIAGKIDQLWRYFFKPASRTPTEIVTYADDGSTPLTTQPITDDGSGNETRGTAV